MESARETRRRAASSAPARQVPDGMTAGGASAAPAYPDEPPADAPWREATGDGLETLVAAQLLVERALLGDGR